MRAEGGALREVAELLEHSENHDPSFISSAPCLILDPLDPLLPTDALARNPVKQASLLSA
jgi:hypothetical protein